MGIAYGINDKTVIRTGAGRFITRLGVSDSVFLGGNPPFQPTANVTGGSVDNPGGTSTNLLPLTVTTQSKAFKNPEAWNWNMTVERQFYWNTLLSGGYVGRRGLHLQRESDINQPTIATVLANPGVSLDALRPYKGLQLDSRNRQRRQLAVQLAADELESPVHVTDSRSAWRTRCPKRWTPAPPSATSSPTPTMRTTSGDSPISMCGTS